jgi:WD40 repeat protein
MRRWFALAGLLGLVAVGHAQVPPVKPKPLAAPIVWSLSFSPDGTRLAVGNLTADRDGVVLVWDVAGRKRVAKSEPLGQRLVGAEFTPDGKAIAVAHWATTIKLLDPKTATKAGEIGPFPSEVTGLTAAGTGRWLAIGQDRVPRLWDEKAKKVTAEFGGFKQVYSWAVSPKGDWLVLGTDVGEKVWNLRTGDEVAAFPDRPGSAGRAAFLTEDRLLITSSQGLFRLVELPSGKEVLRFKSEGGPDGLTYSAAAGVLAGRTYSAQQAALTPFTLRPPTDTEKQRVAALLEECDSDDYPTREKAAAALLELGPAIEPLLRQASAEGPSAEVRMRARVAREGLLNKPKFQLSGHTGVIRTMTFSPDGKLFATGGQDGLVLLWDLATGKEVARFNVADE